MKTAFSLTQCACFAGGSHGCDRLCLLNSFPDDGEHKVSKRLKKVISNVRSWMMMAGFSNAPLPPREFYAAALARSLVSEETAVLIINGDSLLQTFEECSRSIMILDL